MDFPCLFLILFTIVFASAQECSSPYDRCLCPTPTPYCQCAYITDEATFNYSSSYLSHLVLVPGSGCQPCPPFCLKCLSQTYCSVCNDEFELRNGACLPCPINCRKCLNGICSECIDTYYIDSKTNCQSCPLEGTLSCSIDELKKCMGNYWLDNNGAKCVNCGDNCQICSSVSRCSTC